MQSESETIKTVDYLHAIYESPAFMIRQFCCQKISVIIWPFIKKKLLGEHVSFFLLNGHFVLFIHLRVYLEIYSLKGSLLNQNMN